MKINVSQEVLSEMIKNSIKKTLNEQKTEIKPSKIKIKLSELKEVIKRIIKEENEEFKTPFNDNDPHINEENNFILGEGYTHFAIDKANGKIATGWEYNGVDNDDIKYYSKLDLNDLFPDRKASEFKIVTRKYLEKSGINPADQNNWLLSASDKANVEEESKPSADLSATQKSNVVKKAKSGGDIGKEGKDFEDVAAKAAKQYGSKEAGERVAASSMWKNIKR